MNKWFAQAYLVQKGAFNGYVYSLVDTVYFVLAGSLSGTSSVPLYMVAAATIPIAGYRCGCGV